jgi:acyl carrier protein
MVSGLLIALRGAASPRVCSTNALRVADRLAGQESVMPSARDRITTIACRMLLRRGVRDIPGSGDNLREAGLTSLDMVNLMLAIEAEFDIEIPQGAMTPDNFDTMATIDALVSVTARAA